MSIRISRGADLCSRSQQLTCSPLRRGKSATHFLRLAPTSLRSSYSSNQFLYHNHNHLVFMSTTTSILTKHTPSPVTNQLKNSSLFHEKSFLIDNKWDSSSTTSTNLLPVHNPSNGQLLAHIPSVTEDIVTSAICSAHKALSLWSAKTPQQRSHILRKWFDLMMTHSHDLGVIMTLEQGKPVKEAEAEVKYAAGFLEVYANEATRVLGEILPSPSPDTQIHLTQQPVGVVAAITPWNFPSAMITRKIGAAIAAGCTVVLKPSELTPFSAFALAHLAIEAGLPRGVFNIVTGDASMIGKTMMESRLVRKIAFTGSTRVGKLLMKQASDTVKKMSMELGGNAPFIVFADANIDSAIEGIIANKFRNCGQTCVTANRFLIHSSQYDTIVDKLHSRMKTLVIGDGMKEGSILGPLINKSAIEKVNRHVTDAVEKGAKLLYGGRVATEKDSNNIPSNHIGQYYLPTLLINCNNTMDCYSEETFGPVAALYRFDSIEEAINIANDTNAGLAAYLYTNSPSLQLRCGRELDYGMIGINTGSVSTPFAPFGGMKESGFGREGSHIGLRDYLEVKSAKLGTQTSSRIQKVS